MQYTTKIDECQVVRCYADEISHWGTATEALEALEGNKVFPQARHQK